jgi:hypothetical protein
MANPNSALASYALLKVNWSYGGKTYLDNFVPFVAEACYLSGGTKGVSVSEAVEAVKQSFGIDLPPQVMQTVFHRVAKGNLGHLKDKLLHLDFAAQKKRPRLLVQRSAFERSNAELVGKMQAFVLDSFGLTVGDDAAEAALYTAIAANSFEIVKSAVSGAQHTPDPGETPEQKATAAFITRILASDPAGTAHIENLAMGATLAASVYLESADAQTRKFRDTAIYLDTPIALKALGYEGGPARDLTLQTLELARTFGARVAIFEHSVKEIRSVLQGSVDTLQQHGRRSRPVRPVDAYFRDNGYSAIEVQMFQEDVEEDLVELGVVVLGKPDDYARYGIDEKAFEATLQRIVGYRQRPTLLNDLDSIAAVVRLRKNRYPAALESSIATLLSDNTSLQRAARTLNGKHGQWDLVTLDSALATMLWLKQPTLAPTLPLVRVAADCLSALTPSRGFWEDFVVEVDKQVASGKITADDAVALRSTIEAQQAIVVTTGGNPTQLTAASVTRVRDQIVSALTAPVTERLDEASSALEVERRRTTDLERQVTDYRLRETRIRATARQAASRWVIGIEVVVGAVLFISIGVTTGLQFWPMIISLPLPWSALLAAAVAVGSVAVGVGATLGLAQISSVKSWLQRRRGAIERALLKRHELGDAEDQSA